MKKTQVIILAGGQGSRFKYNLPKQFVKISGKYIIEYTLEIFEENTNIDSIIIVVNESYINFIKEIIRDNNYKKVKAVVKGGKTRQESSYNGLLACDNDTLNVLIHDAVRPFLTHRVINEVIKALGEYLAVDVAIPVSDTIIEVDDENTIKNIPNRNFIRSGQTPQGFRFDIIKQAHELYKSNPCFNITDDCGLMLRYDLGKVFVVNGDIENIKITFPQDIYVADKLFQLHTCNYDTNVKTQYNKLKEKVVVIFGFNSGIGQALYNKLQLLGAITLGFSRINGVDVREFSAVDNALKEVFSKYKKIDAVINTSGILIKGNLDELPNESILEQINTNYVGTVNVTKASIEYLKIQGGNIILFTSSSYTRGRGSYSIYSSSKAAVSNFVQAVSEEVKKYSININAINPQRTKTPLREKNFQNENPKTLLSCDEVADLTIKVLCEDRITGQVIDIKKVNDTN